MIVIVQQAGVYNDSHGRAQRCAAGDTLETSPEYAQSLIDSGYVRLVEVAQVAPAAPAKARAKKAVKSAA